MRTELAKVYDDVIKPKATEILSRYNPNETTYSNTADVFRPYGQGEYFPTTPENGERDSRDGFVSFNSGNMAIHGRIDVYNVVGCGYSLDGIVGDRIGALEARAREDYLANGNDPVDDEDWDNYRDDWLSDADIDFKVEVALLDSGELHLRMGIIALGSDGVNPSYDYFIDEMMKVTDDTKSEEIFDFLCRAEKSLTAYRM